MLAPIILCPIISFLLKLASHKSKSYKFKPRFKKLSIAFACEWFYTFTFFSAYNIMISLVINIQSLGINDPISITLAVFSCLLPVVSLLLYFKF